MSDPARFLTSFAQALAAMTLYRDGHPARARAVDAAYQELHDLQADTARPLFTFLGDEVVYGRLPLRELKEWDWGRRLAEAGVQRLEFEDHVSRDDFEGFLDEVLAPVTPSIIDTTESRQMRRTSIRFGAVGLRGETDLASEPLPTATISFSLGEEADTLRWLQREVQTTGAVPLVEAEAVVRSLAVAMHGGRQIVLPLLQLKEFDQYTTTHSMNVSVLSMALAEFQGLGARDVRALGIAGLVHRSEEHTSELQSHHDLVCGLLLEKKNAKDISNVVTDAAPGVVDIFHGLDKAVADTWNTFWIDGDAYGIGSNLSRQ